MPSSQHARRIVVTGLGAVTPIGRNVAELWSALRAGTCGLRRIERFYQNHPSFLTRETIEDYDLAADLAGQIDPFDQRASLKHVRRDKILQLADRSSLFAAVAAHEAMTQAGLAAGLPDEHRCACIVGTAEGGVVNVEAAYRNIFLLKNPAGHPLQLVRIIGSSPAAHLGIEYGVKGPVLGACGACASGAHAIAIAASLIRQGHVDVALAGGTEAPVVYSFMRLWEAAGLLSREGLFPFGPRRSGTVLAEGAGLVVLEELGHARARGATILGELCGVGMTAEAADLATMEPSGAVAAMQAALEDAGLAPDQIDHVGAHGTGIPERDGAEAEAIARVFRDRPAPVPVSATKSLTGNTLGAGAAIASSICLKAIAEGWLPPTLGLEPGDSTERLDVVAATGRSQPVRHGMCNAFALTGLDVSLVYGPPPA